MTPIGFQTRAKRQEAIIRGKKQEKTYKYKYYESTKTFETPTVSIGGSL